MNKVYIVGAGPGNKDLLTIKAYKCIQFADIIFHDELFGNEILDLVPETCEKLNVGKRYFDAQNQTERQRRINILIVENYRKGKNVVRLKTGDPMIFGRGIEEIRYLIDNDVEYEVVPGITAGIAAASLLSVPLTERGKSNAVVFCIGHTMNGTIDQIIDLSDFIKKENTIVLYMGLKNLEKIIEKLIEKHVAKTMNICILSKASLNDQSHVFGNFGDIIKKIKENPPDFPAILLIGKHIKVHIPGIYEK